jgi:hypothetical protein
MKVLFDGSEALTIMTIIEKTSQKPVKLLAIGEWTVQTFMLNEKIRQWFHFQITHSHGNEIGMAHGKPPKGHEIPMPGGKSYHIHKPDHLPVEGLPVKKMDELGYFDFGSQVLLIMPKDEKHFKVVAEHGVKMFPGDVVAVGEM